MPADQPVVRGPLAESADAADLKDAKENKELRDIEKTSSVGDPRSPESSNRSPSPGQSRGNQERLAELEAAIANVTRLLAKTDDAETAGELVAERREMRAEVEGLRRDAAGVVDLATRMKTKGKKC